MKWIESNGGPLVLAPMSNIKKWLGIDGDSGFGSDTDYSAACDVHEYFDILKGRDYRVAVLGDEPDSTGVLKRSEAEIIIIRWRYANDESDLPKYTKSLRPEDFIGADCIDEVFSHEQHILMESALPFADNEDYISFQLASGDYSICTKLFNPDVETCFLAHRLAKK